MIVVRKHNNAILEKMLHCINFLDGVSTCRYQGIARTICFAFQK